MTDYACLATSITAVSRPRSRRRTTGPAGRHHEETSAGGLVVGIAVRKTVHDHLLLATGGVLLSVPRLLTGVT